ncbi:hypothetical protein M3Y99_00456700 [Aphelenchoides fujianensis]|nr:hypothetical protein M3Y99_00456700 [Aphelenchoides fujianensis]
MEAADVKRKPQIRAAVRDGLNRFQLVEKMETANDKREGTTQLKRLAIISRAHLESVRRTAHGIKNNRMGRKWLLRVNVGLGAPKVFFPVDQAEMIAIIRLLGVPISLNFWTDVDWRALESIGRYVNALSVLHDSPAFSAFINRVAPRLRVLRVGWPDLERLPSLGLERARIYGPFQEVNDLNRHKIQRLDVSLLDFQRHSIQSDRVISSFIKSLGLIVSCVLDWSNFSYDSIEGFARRFPSLEDFHITCRYVANLWDLSAYFTALWTKCLEIRDRLHVGGLKRLFITIKHDCHFFGTPNDWFEKLKQVEPFHEATSTIDSSKKCIRMFLKHNEPRGPKPMLVCIKGDFRWSSMKGANDGGGE